MLKLTDIVKTYDGVPVLSGVSIEFTNGKTHALIGPSGCGKSTLLRIITGTVTPDQGTVTFRDQWINGSVSAQSRTTQEKLRQFKKHLGYVIQSGGLFPHLTARENVELPVEAHPGLMTFEQVNERLEELAKLTALPSELLNRYPSQLSGGQRQRVSLMRALMLNPDILLLDEPLGALDPMIRSQLQNDLKAIFEELNKTVVLVTHDLHEARFLAHDVTLLNQGRIEQQGSISDLIDQPKSEFVKKFVLAQSTKSLPA